MKEPEHTLQPKRNKILRIVLKTGLWIVVTPLLLLLILLACLQSTRIQTYLADQATVYVSGKIKSKVTLSSLSIHFPKSFVLKDLYLEDQKKDTLLYSRLIEVDVDLLALFSKKITLNSVKLETVTGHISRDAEEDFNFNFIPRAFASKNEKADTTPMDSSASWHFSLASVVLSDIYFTYHDRRSGTNADLHLGHLKVDLDKFDPAKDQFHVNAIQMDSSRALVLLQAPLVKSASAETSPLPDLDLALKQLNLGNIHLLYKDQTAAQELKVELGRLQADAKKLDLKKEQIALETLLLHNTQIQYTQGSNSLKDTIRLSTTGTGKQPAFNWVVTADKLDLDSNSVAYVNSTSPPVRNQLDLDHLFVKDLNAQANDVYVSTKAIHLNLKDLRFREQNGLILKKFRAQINFDITHAELKQLDLQFNNSSINEHLALYYPSLSALRDSLSVLRLNAEFKSTRIAVKDLLYFSPDLLEKLPVKEKTKEAFVTVSGEIKGSLKELSFKKFELQTESSTTIRLQGSLANVTTPKELYASLSFEAGSTRKDLNDLLSDSLLPKSMVLPDTFHLKGSCLGYVKNFNAELNLESSFGKANVKVTMDPKAGNREQPYTMNAGLLDFDLGKLLARSKTIGAITLSASAKGSGFDTSDLNTNVQLSLIRAVVKDYTYQNFSMNGNFVKKSFTGTAEMHDENLVFDFKGRLDLEPNRPEYTFTLNLTGADLRALHFSDKDLRVSATLQSDIRSSGGKNLTGIAGIRNGLIVRNNRKYPVDSIVLISEEKEGVSDIRLSSEIMTADLKGDITLKDLPATLEQHLDTYFNTQSEPTHTPLTKQKFTFDITLLDPYIITSNFFPSIERLTPVSVNGAYDSQARQVQLKVSVPQVKYNGITLDSLKLDIHSDANKLDYVLGLAELSNSTLKFENMSLSGELKNNNLSFHFATAKDDSVKLLAISGTLKSLNKDFELKLDPKLILNSENWNIDPANLLHFGKEGMYASQLVLNNGSQLVSANSKEKIPAAPLELRFKNFELSTLSHLIENKRDLVKGTANGNMIFEKQNNTSAFRSDLTINDLVFRSVPVGTVKLKAGNLEQADKYNIDMSLEGSGNDIAIKGSYYATAKKELDLLLDIRHLDLKSVEPFTFGEVTKMSGSLSGQLQMKGTLSQPALEGTLSFKEVGFRPKIMDSYLMVHSSKISFASGKIRFDNFVLNDSLNHTANVNGSINISDLQNITLDLRVKTNQFLALNTSANDNPLYYGKIVIDSDIHITGTTDALTLDAKARLNKGSAITYVKPQDQISKNESKGVVEFINPSQKDISIMARRNDSLEGISSIKGIEINASINIDKSVLVKMILDKSTGDSLYVQGGGLLDFGLDRSGKTNLSGKYNISDGGYFLSLENVVKRSFKIKSGSSVTWAGDMLDAYVDITATYTIKTSPLDLVQTELTGLSEMEKNKYRNLLTFQVYLKMSGFISAPEISFDIDLAPSDRGALNGAVNTKLAELREDPSQLNKQVFALLTLRRFVGENPLESSSDGGFSSASRSSASNVLTQQLSTLSQKYVSFVNLDLGVNSFEDYSTGQQQGRTQVQVGVSKQLFNDKVTVRVGGNVDVEGERASQNTANDVAGDINIGYKLTDDGRYKLEASRQNQYENPIEGELTKTAAGVVYTRNFNTFRQLFSKPEREEGAGAVRRELKKEKKKEDEKEEQKEQREQLKQAKQDEDNL